jgi:hypothetical protein
MQDIKLIETNRGDKVTNRGSIQWGQLDLDHVK